MVLLRMYASLHNKKIELSSIYSLIHTTYIIKKEMEKQDHRDPRISSHQIVY